MAPKRKASAAATAVVPDAKESADKKTKGAAADSAAAAPASSPTAAAAASKPVGSVLQVKERSVWWDSDSAVLKCIDQRNLPLKYEWVDLKTVAQVESAIKTMLVRGAPAIGAAGGFGMAIAARVSKATTNSALLADLFAAKQLLDASRPTAVNLSWATARLMELAEYLASKEQEAKVTPDAIRGAVLTEALQLAEDDVEINRSLSLYGAALVKPGANVMHHCNTGRLATVDYGTALGVIYTCHEQGKGIHVWVDETRPRLQGARLTAWELMRAKIDMHLVVDGAAGLLMQEGKVDICFVGADRTVLNGDTANKIGTYKLAVCAREHGVPFYVCVPTSTIDLTKKTGKEIEIEERTRDEVVRIDGAQVAPDGCPVYNPAFDVTLAKYISGIVTEEGICYPPYDVSLTKAKRAKEERIKAEWSKRLTAHLQSASSSSSASASASKA